MTVSASPPATTRRPLPPLAALVAVVAAAPLAAQTAPPATGAAAPDPLPPTLEACYVPASGTVYRINTAASPAPGAPAACLSATHVRFVWNQQGPAGPKGDKGDRGDPGPPGAGGAADHGALGGLADDDHAQYLLAGGARESARGFAVTSASGASGPIPASGPGNRLLWWGARAALRAGTVPGTQWDDANVGSYSVAFGFATIARDLATAAFGNATTASANAAAAFGIGSTASGPGAMAFGNTTTASGEYAAAFGVRARATNTGATAFGSSTLASGVYTTAFGANAVAAGVGATAFGNGATASGDFATAFGNHTTAAGSHAVTFGEATYASGTNAVALGLGTVASQHATFAGGLASVASAIGALAYGANVTASGEWSVALGRRASTNAMSGAFAFGDASSDDVLKVTAPNQFAVRAAGGVRLRTSADLAKGCDVDGQGNLTCTGSVTGSGGGGPAGPDLTLAGTLSVGRTGTFGGGLLATGATPLAVPSGGGTRLMWVPQKAAFRAGQVTGGQWDEGSLGSGSVALGVDAKAAGDGGVALGQGAEAGAARTVAVGAGTRATGPNAVAIGLGPVASGATALAFGNFTEASGLNATAIGDLARATGTHATAIGIHVTASGGYSTALGAHASTDGRAGAVVIGDGSGSDANLARASADNQFLVRAAGGVRLRTSSDLSKGCDVGTDGALSCTGGVAVASAFRRAAGEWATVAKGQAVDVPAKCPAGSSVLAGGVETADGDLTVLASYPNDAGTTWTVRVRNDGPPATARARAHVTCVRD